MLVTPDMSLRKAGLITALLVLLGLASGHENHETAQENMKSEDWVTLHMKGNIFLYCGFAVLVLNVDVVLFRG
jgi:hypothetical protein